METRYLFPDEWVVRAIKGQFEVTDETVEKMRGQRKTSLSEALLEYGFITPAALGGLIMKTFKVPCANLALEDVDKMALTLVPEKVCRRRLLLPFKVEGDHLHIAMANPLDVDALADVQAFSGRIPVAYFALPGQLQWMFSLIFSPEYFLRDLLKRLEEQGETEDESLAEASDVFPRDGKGEESSIVRLINIVVKKAVLMGASDIHLEHDETKSTIRFRIDGLLKNILVLPREIGAGAAVARIKILSSLDIAEHFRPQDGRAVFRLKGAEIGFRVSILPTNNGEKVVMRLLDKRAAEVPFEQLGFRPDIARLFSRMLTSEQGMILVTGPTGSGKTTTLYSALNGLKTEQNNITTVEDPIEYRLDGINQVQVNDKQGLTFPVVLRSVLRQDPDIILVGEIRDPETASIAMQAAMTGHLVFSTLHTNDAMSTIERLRDIGVEAYKIGSCILGVTAQRLVRRLCTSCRQKVPAEFIPESVVELLLQEKLKTDVYGKKGCEECHFTGYKGQIPIVELWSLDNETKKAIAAGEIKSAFQQAALVNGSLQPFWKDALWHLSEGQTSLDEIAPFMAGPKTAQLPAGPIQALPFNQSITVGAALVQDNLPHVLVVDDDVTVRQVYKTILENQGFRVSLAENGLNAVNELVNNHFDLVLLDLMMPEMGGYEVLKSIRQVMGHTDLPVIILTAVSDEKIKTDVLSIGANDYLTKPSNPVTVINRVRSLLRRKGQSDVVALGMAA